MFGRQKQSTVNHLLGSASERLPGTLDSYAAGLVGVGMANWLSTSLFNFDAVQAVAGKKSVSGRTLYGLIGLSGIYAAVRGARKAS